LPFFLHTLCAVARLRLRDLQGKPRQSFCPLVGSLPPNGSSLAQGILKKRETKGLPFFLHTLCAVARLRLRDLQGKPRQSFCPLVGSLPPNGSSLAQGILNQ
jgi:hypothetical protein